MGKRLLVVGECMLALGGDLCAGSLNFSFAGDTYNAAVYAKRWAADLDVFFLTVAGNDCISGAMLDHFATEKIDSSLVLKCGEAAPGAYVISTDIQGEQQFLYWRKQSAATRLIGLLRRSGGLNGLPHFHCVFFSGISLGILQEQDKVYFLELIAGLRSRGTLVAFDPNYRPVFWQNSEHARQWIKSAYAVTDIGLPGLEDHAELFGHSDRSKVLGDLVAFGVDEIVVRCGKQGVYGFSGDTETAYVPFKPADRQVDNTAAGNSFAGTYLAARLSGYNLNYSIQAAAGVTRVGNRNSSVRPV